MEEAADYTYSAPMYVTAEFMNYETGEIKSRPCSWATSAHGLPRYLLFIINGTERVVSQLSCVPGVYFEKPDRSTDKETFMKIILARRMARVRDQARRRRRVSTASVSSRPPLWPSA